MEFGCVYGTVVKLMLVCAGTPFGPCQHAEAPQHSSTFFGSGSKNQVSVGTALALYQFPSLSLHCACSEVNGQLDAEVDRRRRNVMERGR